MIQHPELLHGEMFLTNGSMEFFRVCAYKSKRVGNIAHDPHGKVILGFNLNLFPIFISIKEYMDLMLKKSMEGHKKVIAELVNVIDEWASWEDGRPEVIEPIYQKAKKILEVEEVA